MNKFGILLCFLAISFSQSAIPELDWGVIFDITVALVKGMSENDECKCANAYNSHRDKIVPVLQAVWEDVRNGKDYKTAAMEHAHELGNIDDVNEYCQPYDKIQDFAGFGKAKGIQQIGYNIIQNSVEIEGLLKELWNAKGFEGKIIVFGKILKTATGLTFK